MKTVCSLHLKFDPVGKARARSTKNGHHFTPEKTRCYERDVAIQAKLAMEGRPPTEMPVKLSTAIAFKVPESWPKWKQRDALDGLIAPTVKPDVDNVLKALKDALNGIVYQDDAQVVEGDFMKFYAVQGYVILTVSEVQKQPAQAKRVAA
ncbi:MAG: hypothetical protein CME36_09585 [unclassified Hahellaceae]|nr:hypothetical protein [Hahellaceae bacterium]|tara:strand:+ start:23472 stop:23921 length:450 start_codon:yes stop_codon:yes gene_type:complete